MWVYLVGIISYVGIITEGSKHHLGELRGKWDRSKLEQWRPGVGYFSIGLSIQFILKAKTSQHAQIVPIINSEIFSIATC